MPNHLAIDQFRRLKSRTHDYEEALARTNLAVRCWQKQMGEHDETPAPEHRVLTWLLSNHIIQAFYRRYGIDCIPFTIGGMYGYGMVVGPEPAGCQRTDIKKTAEIACGSVRVDPKIDRLEPYTVTKAIADGKDPLWAIDRAARLAVGNAWPDRCPHQNCRHGSDGETYCTVSQIITLMLTMGYLSDAILGTHVACSEYGENLNKLRTHPLYICGFVEEPCFAQEWFELNSPKRETEPWGWIHRSTGDFVTWENSERVAFYDWWRGNADEGLEWMIKRV